MPGTYIATRYHPEDVAKLIDWAKANNIPELIAPEEIHTTLVYSRVNISDVADINDVVENVVAVPVEFHLFGENKNSLVIELDCDYLEERWQHFMDLGATYDFPEYKPHITLSYDLPEGFDLSGLELPNLTFRVVSEYMDDLDEDWADKVVKASADDLMAVAKFRLAASGIVLAKGPVIPSELITDIPDEAKASQKPLDRRSRLAKAVKSFSEELDRLKAEYKLDRNIFTLPVGWLGQPEIYSFANLLYHGNFNGLRQRYSKRYTSNDAKALFSFDFAIPGEEGWVVEVRAYPIKGKGMVRTFDLKLLVKDDTTMKIVEASASQKSPMPYIV